MVIIIFIFLYNDESRTDCFNCGDTPDNFNEKILEEYKNHNFYDFQGSTWAPSLVHKNIWNKVGGLSEEYFPGTGSILILI